MSFTWLRPTAQGGPLRTREQVAAEVHQVSLARGLDTLATVITCMGIDIEVGANDDQGNPQWWCPANPTNWPDSMGFAHDSTSNDGRSCGYLQQQVGPQGQPWWGTTENEMTLAQAVDTFQSRLTDNYHAAQDNPQLAGQFVQDVQGSGFPDRYQTAWTAAWDVVNRALTQGTTPAPVAHPEPPQRPATVVAAPTFKEVNLIGTSRISGNSQDRKGTTIDLALGHTTEGSGGMDLVNYMIGAQVSYHYLIDNDQDGNTVYDLVDTDLASWSVGDANNRSINYVIGRSTVQWTRGQWIANARNAIRIMAYLMVQDCNKYNIKPVVLQPHPDDTTKYSQDPPGISDHKYVTEWIGWGTHTDLGPAQGPPNTFPWDILVSDVNQFATGKPGDDDTVTTVLVNQPSGSIYRSNNDPLPWAGTPMDFIIDAQNHEGRTETLAIEGYPPAVALVKAVADGTSPVSASLQVTDQQRAQSVIDYITAKKA